MPDAKLILCLDDGWLTKRRDADFGHNPGGFPCRHQKVSVEVCRDLGRLINLPDLFVAQESDDLVQAQARPRKRRPRQSSSSSFPERREPSVSRSVEPAAFPLKSNEKGRPDGQPGVIICNDLPDMGTIYQLSSL